LGYILGDFFSNVSGRPGWQTHTTWREILDFHLWKKELHFPPSTFKGVSSIGLTSKSSRTIKVEKGSTGLAPDLKGIGGKGLVQLCLRF
jgi:hypothetical protein